MKFIIWTIVALLVYNQYSTISAIDDEIKADPYYKTMVAEEKQFQSTFNSEINNLKRLAKAAQADLDYPKSISYTQDALNLYTQANRTPPRAIGLLQRKLIASIKDGSYCAAKNERFMATVSSSDLKYLKHGNKILKCGLTKLVSVR